MPQLNPSTFAPQLVWLAITFIGLYILMAKVLLPRIGGAIEGRRDRIASDLDRAEALKAEAERAVQSYEAGLAEARGKATSIGAEAYAKAAAEAAAERERVDAELSTKLLEAERRIGDMKAKAMAEIEKVAAEVAGDIVTRLTGEKPKDSDVAAAVERAQAG